MINDVDIGINGHHIEVNKGIFNIELYLKKNLGFPK